MPQRYRSGDFIYILAARSAGSRKGLLKIDIANAEPRHTLRARVCCHLLDKIDELRE
jgi:hypothetical protein